MVLAKNWEILQYFFLDKIGQGNVFGNVLYKKEALLDYKRVNF